MSNSETTLAPMRPLLPHFRADPDPNAPWPGPVSSVRRRLRQVRAIWRGVVGILWTVIACPIQMVMLLLPGRGKVVFARAYWAIFTWLIGLSVRRIGVAAAGKPGGRRVVFVSNHSSWLDIPVLGGQLEACFVSKDEIARWPGVSLVAKLGRTVFVTRTRGATGRERDDMRARLIAGDNLLLFAEGTSSDGCRVLPFRTAFFSIAQGEDPPLIQPVTVGYDRLGGMPTGRRTRAVFAWYGDMDLARHFWQLAQWGGMRVTVQLHPPLDPKDFPDRKALALAAWRAVAGSAAAMRQNRGEK
jgi:1-acyl-sn-glycerol-3-phosphate acyltransferase